jgi:hypothetical protein
MALATGAAVLTLSHLPAAAASRPDAQVTASHAQDEISAARKTRHHAQRVQRRAVARHAPQQAFGWQQGWTGAYGGGFRAADPSFGPYYSLRAAQASGRCVDDLGYGRWRYCDW